MPQDMQDLLAVLCFFFFFVFSAVTLLAISAIRRRIARGRKKRDAAAHVLDGYAPEAEEASQGEESSEAVEENIFEMLVERGVSEREVKKLLANPAIHKKLVEHELAEMLVGDQAPQPKKKKKKKSARRQTLEALVHGDGGAVPLAPLAMLPPRDAQPPLDPLPAMAARPPLPPRSPE